MKQMILDGALKMNMFSIKEMILMEYLKIDKPILFILKKMTASNSEICVKKPSDEEATWLQEKS